jgi:hypothetical protein
VAFEFQSGKRGRRGRVGEKPKTLSAEEEKEKKRGRELKRNLIICFLRIVPV